jgi:fatty-acyl-CoA synthase
MAGSICPASVMEKVQNILGVKEITICYGMTETSPVSTQTLVNDDIHRQVATVGKVHPHTEIKIVNNDGNIVPRGTVGEFCTRGYSVMSGYWNNPVKTAESIDENGWMHTGDLAAMDMDGYVTIEGRLKDMIIRGGENVYPKEVEDFLYKHPYIRDVQVVGLPDAKYGEEVCAWIVLREEVIKDLANHKLDISQHKTHHHHIHAHHHVAEVNIREYCRKKLSHFKIPRYMHFVEQFPLTVTGKVKKYEIRDSSIDIFNIDRNIKK